MGFASVSATRSVTTGLSATKTAFELIKGAVDLLGRMDVDPSEVQARLLELQGLTLEAQRARGAEWSRTQGRKIRFDSVVHNLRIFLRPEVFNNSIRVE